MRIRVVHEREEMKGSPLEIIERMRERSHYPKETVEEFMDWVMENLAGLYGIRLKLWEMPKLTKEERADILVRVMLTSGLAEKLEEEMSA